MFRASIVALFLVGVSSPSVVAQRGGGAGGMRGGFGGFDRGAIAVGPGQFDRGAVTFGRPGITGGGVTVGPGGFVRPDFRRSRGFPLFGIWGGYGGGYYAPEWFDYYSSLADTQQFPPPVPFFPDEPRIELSNQFPATLTVQLPAPGNVWTNGNKSEGKPNTEWTLTSPNIMVGKEFSFEVIARWTVEGTTFEYNRTIPVVSGNRSKVLVLAGEEVK
jgi:uncharacterized protein (TIGR03000 family)